MGSRKRVHGGPSGAWGPTVKLISIARWTGLAAGLSLALVSLALARVPAGTGQVPAHLSLVAEPAVQLGISPVGRELLSERVLLPGERSVSGLVEVSNFTGDVLDARPKLRSVGGDAPAGLRLELTAGGRTLYDGALDRLSAHLRLGARAAQRVRFRISAPRGADRDVRGRVVKLGLRWTTRAEGR
jgi:hypothetical protein